MLSAFASEVRAFFFFFCLLVVLWCLGLSLVAVLLRSLVSARVCTPPRFFLSLFFPFPLSTLSFKMGIGRDSRHKRNLTGARRNLHQKKRKFELGRPAAGTKIGHKRIRLVRTLGGNTKRRALRLDAGTFSWGTESK